jgi:hypothetical protein
MLRVSFSESPLHTRSLILLLLFAQFCVKIIDRFYLPAYLSRAGDENDWLRFFASYEPGGKIPYQASLEGPGIYYLVNLVANLFRVDYASALTGLAILLGTLYLIPTFIMYRVFFKGDGRLAFAGTLLLSFTDVMVYSTTIARPTLFGLFLIPITVGAFQALRGRFRRSTFIVLVSTSAAILIMHAPITYVVLLSLVSFTVVIFDRVRKWEAAYTLILFASYGLAVLILPFLDSLWRAEFLSVSPLNRIAAFLNAGFFLIFPAIGVVVLALSPCLSVAIERIRGQGNRVFPERSEVTSYVTLCVFSLACIAFCILTLQKYASFITVYYGSLEAFAMLHAWKIIFAAIGLIGIKTIGTRYRRISNDTVFSWSLGVGVVALIGAIIAVMMHYSGILNLDERFTEFAYFPAIYFVTVGLKSLAERFSSRTFRWLILPLMATYVIPSIIVGTRMLPMFKP